MQKWLSDVKPEEAKIISDGAHKQSYVVTTLDVDEQKVHDKSILNSS